LPSWGYAGAHHPIRSYVCVDEVSQNETNGRYKLTNQPPLQRLHARRAALSTHDTEERLLESTSSFRCCFLCRGGWCNGSPAKPITWDITHLLNQGPRGNVITYQGLFDGQDPVSGIDSPGYVMMQSNLVLYTTAEPPSTPPSTKGDASSGRLVCRSYVSS
jgi:hypothetical protein